MNRFLRTAYSTTFVYLFLALIAVLVTGVELPLAAFLCLYGGLLLALLPSATPKLHGRETLFMLLGALSALLGFLPLLLLRCPVVHWIAHGVGILAAILLTPVLKHRTTHSDFAAKFRFSLVLLLALLAGLYLVLLFGSTEGAVFPIQKERVQLGIDCAVPVAILLLVTGVLLLRGLRGQQTTLDEKAFNRRQLRDLLLYGSIVSVVFLLRPFRYLGKALKWLMNNVLYPAWRWLLWALDQLLNLLASKKPRPELATPEPTPDPNDYGSLPANVMFTAEDPEDYIVDETGETNLYKTILWIFLAVAALIVIVILVFELRKLIRTLSNRAAFRGRGYPNEVRESLDDAESRQKAGKPKKYSADPRMRIRYLYGQFLRFLRRLWMQPEPSDTCGEINERAEKLLPESDRTLAELRALYERARYREAEGPTERDAARMKALLDRLKKKGS